MITSSSSSSSTENRAGAPSSSKRKSPAGTSSSSSVPIFTPCNATCSSTTGRGSSPKNSSRRPSIANAASSWKRSFSAPSSVSSSRANKAGASSSPLRGNGSSSESSSASVSTSTPCRTSEISSKVWVSPEASITLPVNWVAMLEEDSVPPDSTAIVFSAKLLSSKISAKAGAGSSPKRSNSSSPVSSSASVSTSTPCNATSWLVPPICGSVESSPKNPSNRDSISSISALFFPSTVLTSPASSSASVISESKNLSIWPSTFCFASYPRDSASSSSWNPRMSSGISAKAGEISSSADG